MGQFFEAIPSFIAAWALKQQVFWVATAPLSESGHVNISPKGGLYFGLVDDKTFWYMDLSGSGSETISHLYEPGNGRITVMFNAFEGPPRILRLFGHGRVLEHATPAFDDFVKKHDVKTIPGARAIVLVDIHQVGTSCGYSVPYFDFKAYRNTLNEFFKKRVDKFAKGETDESMEKCGPVTCLFVKSTTDIVWHQVLGLQERLVDRWPPRHAHCPKDGQRARHYPDVQNGRPACPATRALPEKQAVWSPSSRSRCDSVSSFRVLGPSGRDTRAPAGSFQPCGGSRDLGRRLPLSNGQVGQAWHLNLEPHEA